MAQTVNLHLSAVGLSVVGQSSSVGESLNHCVSREGGVLLENPVFLIQIRVTRQRSVEKAGTLKNAAAGLPA